MSVKSKICMVFPVVMYGCELDHKEGWAPKNLCLWTVVLKTLERPLYCKEVKPVNPKGNQPWIFIGRTDAKAETPILWPLDAKSRLIGKDPDAGENWGLEEKVTGDETVGWHHWLNGHEFKQTLGDSEGQGSLTCCSWLGYQRVRHDEATKQQQERICCMFRKKFGVLLHFHPATEILINS